MPYAEGPCLESWCDYMKYFLWDPGDRRNVSIAGANGLRFVVEGNVLWKEWWGTSCPFLCCHSFATMAAGFVSFMD
jgi:hypothetical protein